MSKKSVHIVQLLLLVSCALAVTCYLLSLSSIREEFAASSNDLRDSEEEANPTFSNEAHEWRMLAWRDENGNIPPDALQQALETRDQYLHQNLDASGFGDQPVSHLTWISRGPNNVGGRTRAVVVHPSNSQIVWAGSVGGGVWKSIDGGKTWLPMNGDLQNYIVTCLTLDTNDQTSNTLYAGTGEDAFNQNGFPGQNGLPGGGIFKSTNGGLTWTRLFGTRPDQNPEFRQVMRVSIAPGQPGVLLASTSVGVYRGTENQGTWTWSLSEAGRSHFVSFDPNNWTRAVAEIMTTEPVPEQRRHRAMFSTNGGVAFSEADNYTFERPYGNRIEFAYSKNNPGIVYAQNNGSPTTEISYSVDGGATYSHWNAQTPGFQINPTGYANALWVSPNDPSLVVVGGQNSQISRSIDGGHVFTQISDGVGSGGNQPHTDHHCLISDPQNPLRVYACNDGGIYKAENISTASTTSGWENLNSTYRTTQYYGAAGYGQTGLVYGGTQDNGTIRSYVNPSPSPILEMGGDGGFAGVSSDGLNAYGTIYWLRIFRNGTPIYCGRNHSAQGCWPYNADGKDRLFDADGNCNFVAPFVVDPSHDNRVFAGGRSLWRTDDALGTDPIWYSIKSAENTNISAIAVAPSDSNIVWVGYNDSRVYKTTNALSQNPTWTAVDSVPIGQTGTPNPFARYIARILIDNDNPNLVYVAQGGFTPDNLQKTTNGGSSWVDITGPTPSQGGLPDVPIRGIARHPNYANKLYVGTEIGLYSTSNGGTTWLAELDGPTNVSVDEVTFMRGSTTLLAATHGRGVWTAETIQPPNAQHELYDFDGDGLADIGVFRPTDGYWHVNRTMQGWLPQPFGVSGDIPVAQDYDGDGKTDIAVFRPSNATWYWLRSSNGTLGTLQWGQSDDIPAPADFDGDGLADQAVYDPQPPPTPTLWHIHQSTAGDWHPQWGINTDFPYPADYNGDGHADLGVFRLKEGAWYLYENGNWRAVQFGLYGDIPAAADYTGDAKADVAVWRPSTGYWWVLKSEDPTYMSYYGFPFGLNGDIPVPADYDGDGKTDPAVFRPSDGHWYLLRSTSGFQAIQWGASTDRPIQQHQFYPAP